MELQTEIEALKVELAKSKSEVVTIDKLKQDHKLEIDILKAAITQKDEDYMKNLESLEKLLVNLKNKHLETVNELELTKSVLNEKEAEILHLREEILLKEQELNSNLEVAEAKKIAFQETISSLQSSLKSLSYDYEVLSTNFKNAQYSYQNDTVANQALINELKLEMTQLKENLVFKNTKLETLLRSDELLKLEIKQLQNEISLLLTKGQESLILETSLELLKAKLSSQEILISELREQLNSVPNISELEIERERLNNELGMLKESNENISEINSTLMEQINVKDDLLIKHEEEISTCLSSMVKKNNYINALQDSMSHIRSYFQNRFSPYHISQEINNKVPDSTILNCLMAELLSKNNALDEMKKLVDNKITIIENLTKNCKESEFSMPLDKSLSKINSLKAFFEEKLNDLSIMNKELDEIRGSNVDCDVLDDASCGDDAIASTSVVVQNSDVECKDLKVLKNLYAKLAKTLSNFEEVILRLKKGEPFEDPFEIELSKLQMEVTVAVESNAYLLQSQSKLEQERSEISAKLQILEEELMKLKNEINLKDGMIKQLSATIEEVEENLEEVYAEKSNAVEKLSLLEKENSDRLEEICTLKEILNSLTTENINLNKLEETAKLEQEIQILELESEKEQLEMRVKELESNMSELVVSIKEQSDKILSLNQQTLDYEEQIGNLRLQSEDELDKLNSEKEQLETRVKELESNLSELVVTIREQYNNILSLNELIPDYERQIANLRLESEKLQEEFTLARKYADEAFEDLCKAEEALKADSDINNKFSQMAYELDHSKESLKTLEAYNTELEVCMKNYESNQHEISNLNDLVRELNAKLTESSAREKELVTYKDKFEENDDSLKNLRKLLGELQTEKQNWLVKEADFLMIKKELEIVNSAKQDVEDSLKKVQDEHCVYETKLADLAIKNDEKLKTLQEMEMKVQELKKFLHEKNETLEQQVMINQNLKTKLNESLYKHELESLRVKAEISKAQELFEVIKEKDNEKLNLEDLLRLSEQACAEIKEELSQAKANDLEKSSIVSEKEAKIFEQCANIKRLEDILEKHQSEIMTLNKKLSDTNTVDTVLILEHRVEVLQRELKITSQEKDKFVLKCEELEGKLSAECEAKEKSITELNLKIFQHENELFNKIQVLEESLREYKQIKHDLEAKCDTLTAELFQKTLTDENYSALKECFELKERELNETKVRLLEVEEKMATAVNKLQEVGESERKLNEYQLRVNELLQSNTELEKDKNALKGKIFLSNKMLKRGESERVCLENDYKFLKKNFDELQTEKEKFEKLHKNVDDKHKDLEKQIKSLQKKLETLDMQNGILQHENITLKNDLNKEKIEKMSIWKQLEEQVLKPDTKASTVSKPERNLRSGKVSSSSLVDARGRERALIDTEPSSKFSKLNFDECEEPVMPRSVHRRSLSSGSYDFQLSSRKSLMQPSLSTNSHIGRPEPVVVKRKNKAFQGTSAAGSSFATAKKRPLRDKNVDDGDDNDEAECQVQ